MGLLSLAVFGSGARGELTPDSDVDFLYEFDESRATLDNYLELQSHLSDALGRSIDLVSRKYAGAILLRRIEPDLVPLFDLSDAGSS